MNFAQLYLTQSIVFNSEQLQGKSLKEILEILTEELENKQDILVSGDNIKTINGESILGSGDLVIETSGGSQTLTEVLALGNETLEQDIIFTEGDRVVVGNNRAGLGKGTFDTERTGDKGVSLFCAVGYELNWQAGYLRVIQENGDGSPLTLYSDSELEYSGEVDFENPSGDRVLVSKAYVDSVVIGGTMIYPDAGIAISTGTGWGSSITNNSSNWNTAYGWGDHSIVGYITSSSLTGYATQIYVNSQGFVTASSTTTFTNKSGAISQWTNDSNYITANQTITLSGDVTGSGTTSITTTITNGSVDIAMLSATGTPSSTTYLRGDGTWATPSGGGGGSGTVNTGVVRAFALYPSAGTTVDDSFTQNAAFTTTFILGTTTLTASRTITLPSIDADDTIATLNSIQTFTTAKTFLHNTFALRNPANTFSTTLITGAVAANRTITFPEIGANAIVAYLEGSQTFTGTKTFNNPVLGYHGTYGFQAAINSIGLSWGTGAASGTTYAGISSVAGIFPSYAIAFSLTNSTALSERLRITNAGDDVNDTRIGFQVTSPSAKVHIKDTNGRVPILFLDGVAKSLVVVANTECRFTFFNAAYNKIFASGTVTAQRENYFTAPTYIGFSGTVTFTNSATLTISGAPIAGANSVFTNTPSALWVESGQSRFDGNVLIGGTTPSAAALLEIVSTTRGVRFPNMTTTQKNAIGSPVSGLVVYDTTLGKLCVYTTAWETITSV